MPMLNIRGDNKSTENLQLRTLKDKTTKILSLAGKRVESGDMLLSRVSQVQ